MTDKLSEQLKNFIEEIDNDEKIQSIEVQENEMVIDFKNNVYKYTELEKRLEELNKQLTPFKEHIKPITEAIKETKNMKKDLSERLITFMNSMTVTHCNLPNKEPTDRKGAISCSETLVKKTVTEAYSKERLLLFFMKVDNAKFNSMKPEEKAATVHNYIYKERPKVSKQVIKMVPYQIT